MAIVRFTRRTAKARAAAMRVQDKPRIRKKWNLLVRIPWRVVMLACAVVIPLGLGGGSVYALFWSPYFTIDYIEVHNDQGVDATKIRTIIFDQMERPRLGIFPQKSIAAFSEEEARKRIWDDYALDRLVIEKKWPHALDVTIEGTPFALAWLAEGKWYHLDAKGGVAREADVTLLPPLAAKLTVSDKFAELKAAAEEGSLKAALQEVVGGEFGNGIRPDAMVSAEIPLVMDTEKKGVALEARVIPQDKVAFIVAAARKMREAQISPLYFKTTQSAIEVYAVTDQGWAAILNSHDDINEQIKSLTTVLREEIKDKRNTLQYIDVRFGNRVFYKL